MKKKCIFLFTFLTLFFAQNIFAYNYCTHIHDWRGENIYNVCASDFTDGSNVAYIIDLNRRISYCFAYPTKSSAMEMYQLLSRMNVATLEEVIRSTQWKYWFTQYETIHYKANGLY